VNDVVHPTAGRLNRGQIGDTAYMKINFVPYVCEVRFVARRKIVENDYMVTAANEFIHHIRTDEACAACNKVTHSRNSPSGRQS
jgi:hypothetical protein